MAGFEAWSDLIRDAVYWVTEQDLRGAQSCMAETADIAGISRATLFTGIREIFGSKIFTAQELFDKLEFAETASIQATYDAADSLKGATKRLNSKSLGHVLANHRQALAQGWRLEQTRQGSHGNHYRVVPIAEVTVVPTKPTTPAQAIPDAASPSESKLPRYLKSPDALLPDPGGSGDSGGSPEPILNDVDFDRREEDREWKQASLNARNPW
jgi:hypothetical protein